MDKELVVRKLEAMPDYILKKVYENYIYELLNEVIPQNDFSIWYLLLMKRELKKRGWNPN